MSRPRMPRPLLPKTRATSGRRVTLAATAVLWALTPLLATPPTAAADGVLLTGTVTSLTLHDTPAGDGTVGHAPVPAGADATSFVLDTPTGNWEVTGPRAQELRPHLGARVAITGQADPASRTVRLERIDTALPRPDVAARAAGTRRILVLKATVPGHRDLRDREGRPISDAAVSTGFNDVREFYLAASSNQLTFTHQVHSTVLRLGDDSDTSCWNFSKVTSAARDQAAAAGLAPDGFDHVVVVVPHSLGLACDPNAAARASTPGRYVVSYGWLTQNALGHELGHNLGSQHSVNAVCTASGAPAALADGCTLPDGQHPGDDLLGNARFAHNGFHRALYGWVTPRTVTTSGSYSLAPLGTVGATPQVLRLQRANGEWLYLDVRRSGGPVPATTSAAPQDPAAPAQAALSPTTTTVPDRPDTTTPPAAAATGVPPTGSTPGPGPTAPPRASVASTVTDDYLLAGETLTSGQYRTASGGSHRLTMQPDGNLVLRRISDGVALWSTGTVGNTGARLTMQPDGNLVVYSATNAPLWSSGTVGTGANRAAVTAGGLVTVNLPIQANTSRYAWTSTRGLTGNTLNALGTDTFLYPGTSITSPDGRYRLTMQSDGNLTLDDTADSSRDWSSRTGGNTGAYAVFQPDGDLRVWSTGASPPQRVLWTAGSASLGAAQVVLGNDGVLRTILPVTSGWRTVWASSTGLTGASSSTLIPSSQLTSNQYLTSADGTHRLIMGGDGNLFLRRVSDAAVVWSANTAGNPGARVSLDADGALKVRSAANAVLWDSGTAATGTERATVTSSGHLTLLVNPTYGIRHTWSSSLGLTGNTSTSLAAGSPLSSGDAVPSPNGALRLSMQSDGNLVLRRVSDGVALWSTGTAGNANAYMYLQPNGEIVVWPAGGGATPLYRSPTSNRGVASLGVTDTGSVELRLPTTTGARAVWTSTGGLTGNTTSVMVANSQLAGGQRLASPDGRITATMQTDGNLVVWSVPANRALWSSGTAGNPGARLAMQPDGNLVLRRASDNAALWSSGSAGSAGAAVEVRNDGVLQVVSPTTGVRWSTGEPTITDPPTGPWTQGLSIRLARTTTPGSYAGLVDTTPGSAGGYSDATLAVASELVDTQGGVRVRNIGFDPSGNLQLSITVPNSVAPGVPSLTSYSAARNVATVSFTPSGEGATASSYQLGRFASATATTGTVVTTVAATARSFTHSAPEGRWFFKVRSVGSGGQASAWSTGAADVVFDYTAPTAPPQLTASSVPGGTRLAWRPADDTGIGVNHYEVRLNGTVIAIVYAGQPLEFTSSASSGRFEVAAVDRMINIGPASTVVK